MQTYTCPTCGTGMQRDLTLFTEHTNQHIMDELKKRRPAWVTQEGYCPKCLDYFKKAIRNPEAADALDSINIGPREVQKRFVLALFGVGAGFLMFFGFKMAGFPKIWRFFIFIPFFAGALGFFQAKKKLCVVYAQKDVRNMDKGEERISNPAEARAIRRKSMQIWALSALFAAALSAICFIM